MNFTFILHWTSLDWFLSSYWKIKTSKTEEECSEELRTEKFNLISSYKQNVIKCTLSELAFLKFKKNKLHFWNICIYKTATRRLFEIASRTPWEAITPSGPRITGWEFLLYILMIWKVVSLSSFWSFTRCEITPPSGVSKYDFLYCVHLWNLTT